MGIARDPRVDVLAFAFAFLAVAGCTAGDESTPTDAGTTAIETPDPTAGRPATLPSTTGAPEPGSTAAGGGDPSTESNPTATDVALFLPDGPPGERPLVVLVPGGGWVEADPAGLVPLAESLAAAGAVATTTTYRTASDGAYFPLPAEDVACAIAASAQSASDAGFPPTEIVAAGHSAGAHLAALVTLRADDLAPDCTHPPVDADHIVGLAGPYDVGRATGASEPLFGPDADASDRTAGNPVEHASRRPDVDVLLVHGAADSTVPVFFTEQFAAALLAGGHAVEAVYPEGVDHHTVYSAEHAGPLIIGWLDLDPATGE